MKRLNNAEEYEPITIYLDPIKTPIAYANKVRCLMLSGSDEEEARKMALEPIECEIYYEVGTGLFAVESDAADSIPVYSPYTKEEYLSKE